MTDLERRAKAILALKCIGEDTKAVIRELLTDRPRTNRPYPKPRWHRGFDCNNTEPYSSITKEPM